MRSFFKLFTLAILAVGMASAADDYVKGPVDTGQAVAELVSDVAAVRPGQSFELALRLKMDPHWHAYWINPGDTGMPPEVEWTLPEGIEIGELEYPTPERIATPPFVSYGYEGEVFFLFRATALEGLQAGQTISIKADASWLVCENSCIPGDAQLALDLPVSDTGEILAASPWASSVSDAREAIARPAVQGALSFEKLTESLTIKIDWPDLLEAELDGAYFFVEQEAIVDSAKAQNIAIDGESLLISNQLSEFQDGAVDRISGILYSEMGFAAAGGSKSVYFDSASGGLVVEPAILETASDSVAIDLGRGESIAASAQPSIGFAQALLFAFLGGMILNLMPCVFPILSIKILGFVQQSGEDQSKVLKHGVVFTVGVLFSFWVLAGILIGLRAGGESLGWGFQLQEPGFIAVLLVIMFLFGLSLMGVFEIGTSAIGLAGKVKGDGYGGSFFSGILATAVATPCTGPFMGPALGFALTLSAIQSLTVFTFLALGMATPYLLLSAFPKLIEKLPRPGAWMETFKQVMAFPMFATCVWLIWLMGAHVGNDGLIMVLGGLLVLSIAAWLYGKWATPVRKLGTRRLATALALVIGGSGLWLMLPGDDGEVSAESAVGHGPDRYGIEWMAYSPDLVDELRGEGRAIFIDFTAKWCLTCKANKTLVFNSDEVKGRFKDLGVAMVEADWTKRNPIITEALQSYNRSGVPLYILYGSEKGAAPIILPELLNPGIVLEALDQIDPAKPKSVAMN